MINIIIMNDNDLKKYNDEVAKYKMNMFDLNIFQVKKIRNPECKNILEQYAKCIKLESTNKNDCILMKKNIDKICKKNYLFN